MKIRDPGLSLATVCDVVPVLLSLAGLDTRLLSIDVKFYQSCSLTWLDEVESSDEAGPITECLASGEVRGVRPKILSSL